MKKLRDIMRHGYLFTVQRGAMVAEAVRTMAANNVGIVAVLDDDRLIGVFSERDVVQKVLDRGLDPARTPVAEVMPARLVVADLDQDYQSAMSKLDQANNRHLPVVNGERLLSTLSIPRPLRDAI